MSKSLRTSLVMDDVLVKTIDVTLIDKNKDTVIFQMSYDTMATEGNIADDVKIGNLIKDNTIVRVKLGVVKTADLDKDEPPVITNYSLEFYGHNALSNRFFNVIGDKYVHSKEVLDYMMDETRSAPEGEVANVNMIALVQVDEDGNASTLHTYTTPRLDNSTFGTSETLALNPLDVFRIVSINTLEEMRRDDDDSLESIELVNFDGNEEDEVLVKLSADTLGYNLMEVLVLNMIVE